MFLNETDMNALLDSKKAPALQEGRETQIMKTLLENQARYMVEDSTSLSGDVATFTKILVPAVRRIFPALFAKELVSVQPLSTPTGYVYAQRFFYKGSTTTPLTETMKVATFDTLAGGTIDVGDVLASGGTVKYVEVHPDGVSGSMVVDGGTTVAGADSTDAGATTFVVTGVYSSQSAYKQILHNYSGPFSTADGEQLGDAMNQVGFKIDKTTVTAKSRKLKSEYTVELIQDLLSQHGMNAETELLNLLQFEIQADIDREILAKVIADAKLSADVTVNSLDGRWEAEKFAIIYTKILKLCEDIAIDTKRGSGNVGVFSPGVIAALSLTGKLKFSSIDLGNDATMGHPVNVAFVGTLDNGLKVYRDSFATEDYMLIGYKGLTAADAGMFFAPYTPLQVQRAVNPVNLQPVIGLMSRYGLVENPLVEPSEGNPYYRYATVDFTGTSIA